LRGGAFGILLQFQCDDAATARFEFKAREARIAGGYGGGQGAAEAKFRRMNVSRALKILKQQQRDEICDADGMNKI